MKKQTELDFQLWIAKIVREYLPKLGLSLHEIKIEKDPDMDNEKDGNGLQVSCSYPYLDTTIYYGNKSFNNWKKGHIHKYFVVHELCHILTDPLYFKATNRSSTWKEINDERERLTDTMAMIIRRLESNKSK